MRQMPIIAFVLLAPILALATTDDVRVFRKQISQVMGSTLSQDQARAVAVAKAKQEALEEAGTYLQSFTVVRNANLKHDEIIALSSGIVETKIIKEEPYVKDGVLGLFIEVEIQVDSSTLDKKVKDILEDQNNTLQQLYQTQRQNAYLLQQISEFDHEGRKQNSFQTPDPDEDKKKDNSRANLKVQAISWFILAQEQDKSDDPKDILKAIEYCDNAIRIEPEFADAYFHKGFLNYRLKNYSNAIDNYSTAIRFAKRDTLLGGLYFQRAVAWSFLGRFNNAVSDIDKSLKFKPNNYSALRVKAIFHAQMGQHEPAITLWTELIQLRPQDATAYYYRGLAHEDIKNFSSAIQDFSMALHIDPKYYSALIARARAHQSVGDSHEAITDSSSAISINPARDDAYYFRGTVQFQLGHSDDAISDLSEAIKRDATKPNSYNNRGWVYYNIGMLDKAVADYSKAIEISGKVPQYVFNRAIALSDAGSLDKAMTDFSWLAESGKNDWRLAGILGRADVLFRRGEYISAFQEYDRLVVETNADLPEKITYHLSGYFGKGNCAYRREQIDEAICQYSSALSVVGKFRGVLSIEAASKLGDFLKKRVGDVDMAIGEHPENEGLQSLKEQLERASCSLSTNC